MPLLELPILEFYLCVRKEMGAQKVQYSKKATVMVLPIFDRKIHTIVVLAQIREQMSGPEIS